MYLSRPIFEFAINWSDPVNKRFTFDLGDVQLGFGAPVFTSLQETAIQGYDFSIDLRTDAEIKACDLFFAALFGRLNGFWLPAPFEAVQLNQVLSTTQVRIENQKLAQSWSEQKDLHLYFSRPGYDSAAAKIVDVEELSSTLELVTLGSEVNIELLRPAATVRRLHYVRLADDTERAKYLADGWQKRGIRVVELPSEYTEVETGQRPIWLYRFTLGNPSIAEWRYTSFAVNTVSNGKAYTASAITHGAIREGLKLADETVQVEVAYDANHPLALFLPFAPSAKMFVEIIEVDYTTPNTQKKRFVGQVRKVKDAGDRLIAECESFISLLNRKVPRMMIQPECNWHLFDQNCTLKMGNYTLVREIQSLAQNLDHPPVVALVAISSDLTMATNYYRGGFLFTGSGKTFEARTILNSSVDAENSIILLKLNLPLRFAIVGKNLRFTRACDGKAETCQGFHNFHNFGGFVSVPDRNPALMALDLPVSRGGKK